MTTHSPLGASAAERWINCPGSVKLNQSLPVRTDVADPEYRKEGTAAHDAIAYCLSGDTHDAWEVVGQEFGSPKAAATVEMADAIQVFLDEVNPLSEGADCIYVEENLSDPDHPLMFGTIDFGAVKAGMIYVRDFKYGRGIVVETKGNVQMMYYAYLLLLKHPDARRVNMRIMQPRVPYTNDEAWEISSEELYEWAQTRCFPAMARTKTDDTLCPGEWCRFCEAKAQLQCPALDDQFIALADWKLKPLNDFALLADWKMIATVKMHIKAIEDEVMRRLMDRQLNDNGVVKLVNKKANRVWKPEAIALFKERFGDKAMNPPEFKSPAEMEKVDATAKKMVHEYAFTPQSGYTVASIDDKRAAVILQSASEAFAGVDTVSEL